MLNNLLGRDEVITVGDLIKTLQQYDKSDIVMVCGNIDGYECDRLAVLQVLRVPYAPHEVILEAWDYDVPLYDEQEEEDESWIDEEVDQALEGHWGGVYKEE